MHYYRLGICRDKLLLFELGNIVCEYHIDYKKEEYNFDLINNDLIESVIKYYNNEAEISEENIRKVEAGINMSHFSWALYALIMVRKPVDPNLIIIYLRNRD